MIDKCIALHGKLAHVRQNALSLESRAGEIDRLHSLIDSLENRRKNASRLLTDSAAVSDLFSLLIATAKNSGMQFVKMQPQPQSTAGGFIMHPVIVEMTAGYNAFGRFVAALEALPQAMRIERIALTAHSNDALEIKLLITCFQRPVEK